MMDSTFFTKDEDETMEKAIRVWGNRQQVIKAIEEMAELTVVLTKWLNVEVKGQSFVNTDVILRTKINDEIADVAIMHRQLLKIFGEGGIKFQVGRKIKKLKSYLSLAESQSTIEG